MPGISNLPIKRLTMELDDLYKKLVTAIHNNDIPRLFRDAGVDALLSHVPPNCTTADTIKVGSSRTVGMICIVGKQIA